MSDVNKHEHKDVAALEQAYQAALDVSQEFKAHIEPPFSEDEIARMQELDMVALDALATFYEAGGTLKK